MAFDPEDIQAAAAEQRAEQGWRDYVPSKQQKIRSFTVYCLILNRTIGSGIFVSPAQVLKGTGDTGTSLVFWAIGALVAICGTLVWLELGLSVPRADVGGRWRGVPRSGGEKNFFEHILPKPLYLATCMFGIIWIVFGNLAGNSIAVGEYLMGAAGYSDPPKGAVIGIAIGANGLCILVHVFSRRGGLFINNCFAIYKVALLLVIIILGFGYRAGVDFGNGNQRTDNFDREISFSTPRPDLPSYSNALLYVLYSFGFKQPFYVLSEIRQPRKKFPIAVLGSMTLVGIIFFLVNIAYLCAVPKNLVLGDIITPSGHNDMSVLFFRQIFGHEVAERVMSGAIAISILGNILVMTFTASKVKQEIAKEGILPWSVTFATGKKTPDAWLKAWWQARKASSGKRQPSADTNSISREEAHEAPKEQEEQSPMAALLLHWCTTVFLIAVTSMLNTKTQYFVLVSLYAYTTSILMGFLAAAGLLYLKLGNHFSKIGRQWHSEIKILGGPTAAIIYCFVLGFLGITLFIKPADDSPFAYDANGNVEWFIVPTIGLSTLLWGVLWWYGLHAVMWKRGRDLVVTRKPYCERDGRDAEWVMKYEVIDHDWVRRVVSRGRPASHRSVSLDSLGSGST